jgi:hypothetical protein
VIARWRIVIFVAVAAAACGGGAEESTTTSLPESSPPPDTPAASSTTTEPAATTTVVPASLAPPPVFDRWTTILASLPEAEYDEAAAMEAAASRNESDVGLLFSNDYPSLNRGYWVVFSGDFATQQEAIDHCAALQERAVACYHRYLGEAPVVVAGFANGTAVGWVGGGLRLIDPSNGTPVSDALIDYGGGVFPGAPQLAPDGTGVYVELGFEDAWYQCETAAGRIDRIDLTTGTATPVAEGFSPQLSPDGVRLAYVASSRCVPSSDNELEVIAYADTLAVLDLVTGRVLRWQPSPGAQATPESVIDSLAWTADGTSVFVAMADGTLRLVDLSVGAALDATPEIGSGRTAAVFGAWILEGIDGATGRLVAVEWDYELVTSRIVEINPATGRVVAADPLIDGFAVLRLDATGTERILTVDGRLVTPAGTFGPDPFYGGADW